MATPPVAQEEPQHHDVVIEEAVVFKEQIALLGIDDLRGIKIELVAEIQGIDGQLASKGRDENGAFLMDEQDYYSWRRRAVGAKRHKVAQLALVKEAIHKAETARMDGKNVWKKQALALRSALREVKRVPELPRQALQIIEEALDEYEEAAEALLRGAE